MRLLADPIGPFQHHISLMHGWVPITVQTVAAVILLLAVGWRSRRWRLVWLPFAVALGLGVALLARWYLASAGLAGGDPAPPQLWLWIALTGLAVGVLLFGWRAAPRWRHGAATLAVPLCLLSAALALNGWVGYFPTVQNAWNQLTAGPLPDQIDAQGVSAEVARTRQRHTLPARGSVVPVTIPATASGFRHRGELVYLPPAWFASTPPPALPTVMMIGGEFNTPADWLRAGDAISTVDRFAAAHGGSAPVLVFVDSGGGFNKDTECVNGSRGNAADHLTKDVVPYLTSAFGVSAQPANWGIVGWSMGGTCAVDLTTMHPDMFSAFVDIAGDLSPNSGTRAQTIARLYGGSSAAWAAFDPVTVISKHGPYQGISGWFGLNGPPGLNNPAPTPDLSAGHTTPVAITVPAADSPPANQTVAANTLCALGSANGIDCAVVSQPGKHDWPFAARVFATSLPWLAGTIGTPGVARTPLPTAPPPNSTGDEATRTEAAAH